MVIDCANGAAYRVAPGALWEMGADVIAIGVDPDGFNINKECGSTDLAAIQRKVREMRADIGIALDGDADRVMIIDERGHVVDGDQLLAVIAASWKEDGRLSKPGVVGTVMSNLGLERHLKGLGLGLVRTPVGDRYVLEHMRTHGYNLGGEPSGHIIMSDYTTTGDGFIAALAGAGHGQAQRQAGVGGLPPLRGRCRRCSRTSATRTASRWKARPCARRSPAPRRSLAVGGRLIVRPSGTEPVIRVMGEGDDKVLVEAAVDDVVEALTEVAA